MSLALPVLFLADGLWVVLTFDSQTEFVDAASWLELRWSGRVDRDSSEHWRSQWHPHFTASLDGGEGGSKI